MLNKTYKKQDLMYKFINLKWGIIVMLLAAVSCSNNQKVLKSPQCTYTYNSHCFNFIEMYNDSCIKILGNKNAKDEFNGLWMKFNSDGHVIVNGFYKKGKKHGNWNWFSESGVSIRSGRYRKNIKIGLWLQGNNEATWYKRGKIIKKGTYSPSNTKL